MGASTICIKDMAGIMGPKEAYDLVSAIKDAAPELPIDLHTHSTTGLAFMTYLKAVEAGVDIIDTAISPFSGGTSQPATETLAYALRQLATRSIWTTSAPRRSPTTSRSCVTTTSRTAP